MCDKDLPEDEDFYQYLSPKEARELRKEELFGSGKKVRQIPKKRKIDDDINERK